MVEYFRESVCTVFSMITGRLPAVCRCTATGGVPQSANSTIFSHERDASKVKAEVQRRSHMISLALGRPDDRGVLISRFTRKDEALYAIGLARFWELLRREEVKHNATIWCGDRALPA